MWSRANSPGSCKVESVVQSEQKRKGWSASLLKGLKNNIHAQANSGFQSLWKALKFFRTFFFVIAYSRLKISILGSTRLYQNVSFLSHSRSHKPATLLNDRFTNGRTPHSNKCAILIAYTFTSAGTSVLKQQIKSVTAMIFISAEACFSFFMVLPSTHSRVQNYNVLTPYHDSFGFLHNPHSHF